MKPVYFDYKRPASVSAAIDLMKEDPGSKILAGGQSLLPMMAFRLVQPTTLIDITRIPELGGVLVNDESVIIGATATHRSVELDSHVRSSCPIIAEALSHLGHVAIRNSGTVGGSIAHADPAAEWPALLLALGGVVETRGGSGSRRIPARDFFSDYMTTTLATDELIVAIEVSKLPPKAGWSFLEVAWRHGDFAIAGVAAVMQVLDGAIAHARLALIGLGVTPMQPDDVEAWLLGRPARSDVFVEAARMVAASVKPLDDQHAPSGYRHRLAQVLSLRALEEASAKARVSVQ